MNRHASYAETNDAARAGREAFENDGPRAAFNAATAAIIGEASVGEPRTLEIMHAFEHAYDYAVEVAAWRAISSDTVHPHYNHRSTR